jgi:hypothetical protein
MRNLNGLILCLAFVALIPDICRSQCVYRAILVSRVQGTILDPYGKPIPNVEVDLKRDGVRIAGATTNDVGEFSIQATPGKYELHAHADRFASGFARIDLGTDLVRMLRPSAHFWMILRVGVVNDACTFSTTSRRELRRAIQ